MKKLLVATDLTVRSDRAVNRALALADELEAQLVVLHVVDDELPSSVADRLKEEAELAIDDQIEAAPTLKGSVTRNVVFGSGYKDILKEAEDGEIDLIVMGTHREEAMGEFFLGTTVERVIRRGNHPVLVVKNRVKGRYRRVLVGVDFSVYSRRAVEFALKFVPDGEISLVHAFDIPFKGFLSGQSTRREVAKRHQEQMDAMLEQEMQAFLASLASPPASLKRIMQEGSVREVISAQVDKLRPDLLVIGTHGRTGVGHALLGSVAEDLLSYPPCDVLAVKAW
tara:strand:+ start:486 stop:1331 length:846 start_codon:yes stop_codon:yes gene_type:complete